MSLDRMAFDSDAETGEKPELPRQEAQGLEIARLLGGGDIPIIGRIRLEYDARNADAVEIVPLEKNDAGAQFSSGLADIAESIAYLRDENIVRGGFDEIARRPRPSQAILLSGQRPLNRAKGILPGS